MLMGKGLNVCRLFDTIYNTASYPISINVHCVFPSPPDSKSACGDTLNNNSDCDTSLRQAVGPWQASVFSQIKSQHPVLVTVSIQKVIAIQSVLGIYMVGLY